jgi:AcrR family transcriptional regulator
MVATRDGQKRPGRPRGSSDRRERILSSARELFAHNGFRATSVRSIAAAAKVDAALVHHYFGTKEALFAAAVDIPFDPTVVVAQLRTTPIEDLGRAIPTVVLGLWESETQAQLKATLRAALTDGRLAVLGKFLREVVFTEIAARVDDPVGTGMMRVEFVGTQMLGVVMARHIMELQPFAELPIEQVIATIAPNLQHYLTGDLDDIQRK